MHVVDLHLRAGARTLISGLEWRIGEGECWCVVGRNGAGKSTLLRTLAGLREPDGGLVLLRQRPLRQWPLQELARLRAYLPQAHQDAFAFRALDAVLAARHPYGSSRYWESEEDMRAALSALTTFDVAHLAERDVRTLSGGERRRVGLAAVMAQDTPLLLLDEPALALDFAHQAAMLELLAKLRMESNKTVVMVSHDLNLAQDVATHALLMMEGGGWRAGPVKDIMQAPLIGECLGYPVETLNHQGRMIFLPSRQAFAGTANDRIAPCQ